MIVAEELSRLARGELSYEIKNLCENQRILIITLVNTINTLKVTQTCLVYTFLAKQSNVLFTLWHKNESLNLKSLF